MEYKPLDLNKVCSASFMGLSGVNPYQNISLQHAWLCFHFLGQLKSNIKIVYTGAKVSLFWSFDLLFSVSSLHVLA